MLCIVVGEYTKICLETKIPVLKYVYNSPIYKYDAINNVKNTSPKKTAC